MKSHGKAKWAFILSWTLAMSLALPLISEAGIAPKWAFVAGVVFTLPMDYLGNRLREWANAKEQRKQLDQEVLANE